ncbi:hypothetical protein EJB05_42124, partial [Eragrostis curvula]
MLNVHRARLLAGSRGPTAREDEESRVLCAVVASVMSLMLLCGLLSFLPSPRGFRLTKTYVVVGAGAMMLILMLAGWLLAPWTVALLSARRRRRAPDVLTPAAASVRLHALRQMCACGLSDAAALGALPTFAYEPPPHRSAADGGEPARGSCALCAVCLEDVRAGEMVRQLPACGHLFHVCCVDAWLRSHRTCPICRCELPPRNVATKAAPAVAFAPSPDALPPV